VTSINRLPERSEGSRAPTECSECDRWRKRFYARSWILHFTAFSSERRLIEVINSFPRGIRDILKQSSVCNRVFLLMASSYILSTGESAVESLKLQAQIMRDHTIAHLEKAGLKPTDSVFEVGCGTGDVTEILVQHSHLVVAIDNNSKQVEATQSRIHAADEHTFVVVQADITDENFSLPRSFSEKDDGLRISFDKAYARLVLMHLTNPLQALRNMFNALMPGGVLMLQESVMRIMYTVPHSDAVEQYTNTLVRLGEKMGVNFNIGEELPSLCEQAGFTDIESWNVDDGCAGLSQAQWGAFILMRLAEWGPRAIEQGIATQEQMIKLKGDLEALIQTPGIKFYPARQVHIIARKPTV